MVAQEKGIRLACALPYELYANGNSSGDKNMFSVVLKCGDSVFGKATAGGTFYIYALNKYGEDLHRSWNYAVKPGDNIKDEWSLSQFHNSFYHLNIHGPNGFMRSFKGDKADPLVRVQCSYEFTKAEGNVLTGNLLLFSVCLNTDKKIISHSFDKGFYSKDNLNTCSRIIQNKQCYLKEAGSVKKTKKGKALKHLSS